MQFSSLAEVTESGFLISIWNLIGSWVYPIFSSKLFMGYLTVNYLLIEYIHY